MPFPLDHPRPWQRACALAALMLVPSLGAAHAREHAPHDNVHGVAAAPLAGGGYEVVIATSEEEKWLRSRDGGLSWTSLVGDGLELAKPLHAEYWAHPTDPRFVLGTNAGVWFYYPETGEVRSASDGLLPTAFSGLGGLVTDVAAADGATGTVALVLGAGAVFVWDEAAFRWEMKLDSRDFNERAQVTISPDYDPGQPAGARRTLMAGVLGRLHTSTDGGASWSIHPQFPTLAQSSLDWTITDVTLDPDYSSNGTVLVARGRENPASSSGTDGELWRSTDFGTTFTRILQPDSSIMSVEPTPPNSAGIVQYFLALESYPSSNALATSTGVLRSDDRGSSWSDFGNAQDFVLEKEDFTVADSWRTIVDFCPSPFYDQDGTVYFGRSEGLFRSRDHGDHWRPMRVRAETHVRDLDTVLDPSGDLLAFGATYGSATIFANLDTGFTDVLDEVKSGFQDAVRISPNFAVDGTVVVGGDRGVQFWFDPAKPPANPYAASGWHYDPANEFGYSRTIALSPRFDASATVPGSDQILFWSTRSGAGVSYDPRRTFGSLDVGQTWIEVDTLRGGLEGPFMRTILVAPSFDPGSLATRTDVFASSGVDEHAQLHVFVEDEWATIHSFERGIVDMQLHPDWSAVDNPRFFVALATRPHLAIVEYYDGSNMRIKQIDADGLDQLAVQGLAIPPDYSTRPVAYVSTYGGGVFRLDLASASPSWEPVGKDYPEVFTEPIDLSPDFVNDRRIVVGTIDGFAVGTDDPNEPWLHLPTPSTVGTKDSGFVYFDPGHPANPDPTRPWPWPNAGIEAIHKRFPGLRTVGARVSYTVSDGAYVEWEGYASNFELHTYRDANHGEMRLEIFDVRTGALLASQVVDLGGASTLEPLWAALAVPGASAGSPRGVRLRVTALLTAGESFAFDGLSVAR